MSKFWRERNKFWRNSEKPFHDVTHRAIGDIPGCTMAPREGIYRPEPIEQVRQKMHWRIERFLAANAIGNNLAKQEFFSGDSFNEPIFGAYGEKL